MGRRITAIAGLVVFVVVVCFLHGCGGTQTSVETHAGVDRLMIVSQVELTDSEVAQLPSDFEEKAATVGWKRVPGGFEQTGPAVNAEITDGTQSVMTDSDGYFSFSNSNSTNLSIVIGDTQIQVEQSSVIVRSDGPRNWTLTVPYGSCCPKDDSGSMSVRGAMDGRCLDYNGWWSDGQNYGKTDWRAYRNFVASDCDRAFYRAGCWRDHYSGGCWAVHGTGGCSRVIGHSYYYHKHNYPN